VALVFAVDATAVLLAGIGAVRGSIDRTDLLRFAMLAALGLGYILVCQRVERARQLLGRDTVYADVTSSWMLGAAILLPGILTAALILAVYVHMWLQPAGRADARPHPYRFAYTAAAKVLTCGAVAAVLSALDMNVHTHDAAATAILVAIPIYICVDTLIIALAIRISTGTRKLSDLFGSWSENGLELATLVLGAVTALSVLYAPWAAVLVLPAVFLLQHQALLRQLVEAATTDVKTDLLNATAWRQVAQREVTRVSQRGGSAAILVLDMDHFKRINDQHGHLVGDVALRSVGAALADELRGYDAVGRFGGEEFVAVLPDTDVAGAEHAAERLRLRIESLAVPVHGSDETLAVTASIGVALCPEHGDSVDDVLRAADDAMYEAKRAGRNAVRTAPAAAWLRTAAS
jgi:diguanylate cyclase (GGDEF)-like protein